MSDIQRRDTAAANEQENHETPVRGSEPPLLFAALIMLEPYVSRATIELNTQIKILFREDGMPRIVFHCGSADEPCKNLKTFQVPGAEPFALCHELINSQIGLVKLGRRRRVFTSESQTCQRSLAIVPNRVTEEFRQLGETPEIRQRVFGRMAATIRDLLSSSERENLLSVFGEEEFGAFLERDNNLKRIQSIQYKCTRRINMIRMRAKKQVPCRPIIEQHKVGDYLYKLQPGQKGGDYWYLQYSRDGKRYQIYLGKNRPSFEPEKDLAEKQQSKSLAKHN